MFQRMTCVAASLVVLLAVVATVSAQTDDLSDLKTRDSLGAADERRIAKAIESDINAVIADVTEQGVRGARQRLVKLAGDAGATMAFQASVAKVVVLMFHERFDNPKTNRNRMAMAMLVAQMKNTESLPVLLKLLGDQYPSVRYWAAKGLAGKEVMDIVRAGTNIPTKTVLKRVQETATGEKSPIIVKELIKVIGGVQAEAATDALVATVAEKARTMDLGDADAVEAMTEAVKALDAAYRRALRPAAQGKQPIIACLVQILVQTPPKEPSLELALLLDRTLGELTQQKSKLAAAIKACRDQSHLNPEAQKVDLVWLQQLDWMERLLAVSNKDVRLLSRPKTLDWTPEKSVEVIREMIKK
jgi:hypothetical protein